MIRVRGDEIEVRFDDGEQRRLHRGNTALFTFWGNKAMFNHVYIRSGEEMGDLRDDAPDCRYVFQNEPMYHALAECLRQLEYPQYLNLAETETEDESTFFGRRFGELAATLHDMFGSGPD